MAKQQNATTGKSSDPATAVKDATEPSMAVDALMAFHEEVARLAYSYWQARGCPDGSPEEDWFRAEAELRTGQSQPEPEEMTTASAA